MRRTQVFLVFFCGLLGVAASAGATPITYTQDANIADFTGQVLQYATFSGYGHGPGAPGGTFTPTSAEIASQGLFVYDGSSVPGLPAPNTWFRATFSSAVSDIMVFANIQGGTAAATDGYDYRIAGSNDGTTWTQLFDATSVVANGGLYELGGYTGIAPYLVNNIVNGPNGVGYEALFSFGSAYRYYAFGSSTAASYPDHELSAVGSIQSVPEPASLLLLGSGIAGLVARRRRSSRAL